MECCTFGGDEESGEVKAIGIPSAFENRKDQELVKGMKGLSKRMGSVGKRRMGH